MEALRILKRYVRKYPQFAELLQVPSVSATIALRRIRLARWYGGRCQSVEAMNRWIHDRITMQVPSAIGKLGTLEIELLAHDNKRQENGTRVPIPRELKRQALINVGLFPDTDDALWTALDTIRAALPAMDGMAVFGHSGERVLLRNHCRNLSILSTVGGLEPWRAQCSWSEALAGKRVLVVHPFAATIMSQYERARRQIWRSHPRLLPDFELQTLTMPLSPSLVPANEPDWSARLMRLRTELDNRRFDVALVGAGGMSLPLVAHAKALGAVGLHTGGSTQLLFGIRGRRWEKDPSFSRWVNDAWIRPSPEETPPTVSQIENGCYW